jgi:hypothetical protein
VAAPGGGKIYTLWPVLALLTAYGCVGVRPCSRISNMRQKSYHVYLFLSLSYCIYVYVCMYTGERESGLVCMHMY